MGTVVIVDDRHMDIFKELNKPIWSAALNQQSALSKIMSQPIWSKALEQQSLLSKVASQPGWAQVVEQQSVISKILDQPAWAKAFDVNSTMLKPLEQLLPTISAIQNLKNFRVDHFDALVSDGFEIYEDELPASDAIETIKEKTAGIIGEEKDFSLLSKASKDNLVKMLIVIALLFIDTVNNIGSNYIYDNYLKGKNKIEDASEDEVKAIVKGRVQVDFDRRVFKDSRLINADFLSLRRSPSMAGEVIVELPKGTLVDVIDSPDHFHRSWLFVSVEVDGEIETGWINRRYTLYFRLI